MTIAAAVCGKCHTTAHHPTFDEWSESPHRHVTEEVAEELEAGTNANSCGECHSGDARFAMKIEALTIAAAFLKGVHPEEQNGQTCAICHDPHERTGNAAAPAAGMDYQLRYPQITNPEPTNDITTITTNARYGICGQCHRDRGRDWTGTSRGSHHSIQSNVYIGEMPIKTGTALLVPNIRSAHRFVPEQCSTCHMHAEDSSPKRCPPTPATTSNPTQPPAAPSVATRTRPMPSPSWTPSKPKSRPDSITSSPGSAIPPPGIILLMQASAQPTRRRPRGHQEGPLLKELRRLRRQPRRSQPRLRPHHADRGRCLLTTAGK